MIVNGLDCGWLGRPIGHFKGHAGSVRDVAFHATEDIVATASLDRWEVWATYVGKLGLTLRDRNVRLFNAGTRQLIRKIYTKQRLNCVALTGEGYEPATVADVRANPVAFRPNHLTPNDVSNSCWVHVAGDCERSQADIQCGGGGGERR